MTKLFCGFGINDANYKTRRFETINGVCTLVWRCEIHSAWKSMITRCYSPSYINKFNTYKDCFVCDEWLAFSKFKDWAEGRYKSGLVLDKDIIVKGNKTYSPDTCSFIESGLNAFVTYGGNASTSIYPGCYFDKSNNSFRARCNNPFTGRTESLGLFDFEEDAYEAWRKRKHELACQLADLQTDERVANALRNRYL